MTNNGERKITRVRDLPLDITPPRDLWQGIEAQIAADQASGKRSGTDIESARRFGRAAWMRPRMTAIAAAAMIATLAVGIWIGRAVLPTVVQPSATTARTVPNPSAGEASAWYVMDSKYTRERAALVKDLETRLAALPPESRAKVLTSLKAINDSKQQLEAELGKDPSNALLQELLVNTYQDEMRVLTAVHEAGTAGEGI
jgi:hypothetical protein